jgi:cold shock CspA family protein
MTEERPRGEAAAPSEVRERGVVKWFDPEIGYGFIDRRHGEDVFVHIADVQRSGIDRLYEGQQVEFYVKETQKGLQAEGLTFVETDAVAPAAPTSISDITLAEVFYATALRLYEQERLDPREVEAWKGITLADKDPGFRVELDIVGPYEGESSDEHFGRQVDVVEGLSKLAGLSLVRADIALRLRESRGLEVPDYSAGLDPRADPDFDPEAHAAELAAAAAEAEAEALAEQESTETDESSSDASEPSEAEDTPDNSDDGSAGGDDLDTSSDE